MPRANLAGGAEALGAAAPSESRGRGPVTRPGNGGRAGGRARGCYAREKQVLSASVALEGPCGSPWQRGREKFPVPLGAALLDGRRARGTEETPTGHLLQAGFGARSFPPVPPLEGEVLRAAGPQGLGVSTGKTGAGEGNLQLLGAVRGARDTP